MMRRFFQGLLANFIKVKPSTKSSRAKSSRAKSSRAKSSRIKHSQVMASLAKSNDAITYSVNRADVVKMLNRRLRQSDLSSASEPLLGFSEQLEAVDNPSADALLKPADKAFLAECRGHEKAAELLYLQSLNSQRRQLGEQHPEVAIALGQLADLYCRQGRYDEAEPLLDQALQIQSQLELTSVTIGDISYQLAQVYQHQNRYCEADALFQQASTIFRQQLGVEHPRTQAVYNDLMNLLMTSINVGKFEELNAGTDPLDLDSLSETYSWAQPPWKRSASN